MPEGSYQMDHNTLWFIANGGVMGEARTQGYHPEGQRPYKPLPVGPCFECKGDHWVQDCPNKRSRPAFRPLNRFCEDCGIKHLVQDCPDNPNSSKKVTLNIVELIPPSSSPSSSEIEQTIPLNVITRAQAKAQEKEQENKDETPSEIQKINRNSWKARRARRAKSQKPQKETEPPPENKQEPTKDISITTQKETDKQTNKSKGTKTGEGGSVLAKKHHETLDALLQAYEARLKPLETLEERWRLYPNPQIETRRLDLYKRLVETTQALLDQNKEIQTPKQRNPNVSEFLVSDDGPTILKETKPQEKENETRTIIIPGSTVSEVNEEWGNSLWEAVKRTQKETLQKPGPPIEEIDFDQKTLELEIKSQYGDMGSEKCE